MTRMLSVFIAIAAVAALVTLLGWFTRTEKFAEMKAEMDRKRKSAEDELPTPEIDAQA